MSGELVSSGAARTESREPAVVAVSEGGPVIAEVRLQPLTAHSPLLPGAAAKPQVASSGRGGWIWLFVITVLAPMALASTYFFGVAAPRYASTASFIVRSSSPQSDPLAALSQEGSGTIARDETSAVNAYLLSRDLVDQLARNNDLRAVLGRGGDDFLFRYPTFWLPNNNEYLFQRFQWMASAKVDPVTNISTIEVNAFSAQDAKAIAEAMLASAEALVNQMNQRAYQDDLANADRFVAEARKELDEVEAALKSHRNESGSVDPNLVAQSKLKVIEGLSTELAHVEAQVAQTAAVAPTSPTLAGLRAQADSYRKEIGKRKLEIAGSVGSEAAKLEKYEKLLLQRELAAKALGAAQAQRTQAVEDTQRQHLYVQLISRPNLSADFARYPRVLLDLAVLLVLCLGVFQLLRTLGGITAEHRA